MLILILNSLLFFPSNVFGAQELSSIKTTTCPAETSAWTPWFNTQNPWKTNGNDVEDISTIRAQHREAARCLTVSTIDYAVVTKSNSTGSFYQTLINKNGVFCMGSSTSRCPDYQVRFCCPLDPASVSKQCGQTSVQPLTSPALRIVNGFEAKPHSFPWVVSLQYKDVHDCGGVILDQYHILTAAHCLDYANDLGNYFARVGAHNRNTSGQLIPIAELVLHPTYDEVRSSDDIGIIRLASPIPFSQNVQPICLVDEVRTGLVLR